ncbi:hypothetical protein C0J52_14580 [Blattella germanica]|nr:hypothetical protein C0J52_14580 [Blattella germanica]
MLVMVECLLCTVNLKSSQKHQYEHHPCRNTSEFCAIYSGGTRVKAYSTAARISCVV